jgi:hypothetical protein
MRYPLGRCYLIHRRAWFDPCWADAGGASIGFLFWAIATPRTDPLIMIAI